MTTPENDDAYRARIEAEVAAKRSEWDARMAAYDAKWRAFRQRQAEILRRNKAALFEALASDDIVTVSVMFDGSGDSGQIESIDAYDAGGKPAALPEPLVNIVNIEFETLEAQVRPISVRETIENMAYAFLEETHSGWENEDGAYGEFKFTVADQCITLDYNERYVETHYHVHEF